MAEPRKNHLDIDGAQIKDDDNVATYKPIPDTDAELRSSKSNLTKSKEKLSADGAEEKLLPKEEEAKIVTRVDMADARYVVGDHRNGDAKIELDANKRQFSGLTKEELMKYADDPFWVNLRWFLFILFWALWLSMLAGAIVIIVRAPKCAAPEPKTWYEEGPLVDLAATKLDDAVSALPLLKACDVKGIFLNGLTYEILDNDTELNKYASFITNAKEKGIQVIVNLIPNFVSETHRWFQLSQNSTAEFKNYFIWRKGDYNDTHNWMSVFGGSAWKYSSIRQEYYLHQYKEDQPDLNFREDAVVEHFNQVLAKWAKLGVAGVRLIHARQALVDPEFRPDRVKTLGVDLSAGHDDYSYWTHLYTSDQPGLDALLSKWRSAFDGAADAKISEPVFMLEEEVGRNEFWMSGQNTSAIRPLSAAVAPPLPPPQLAEYIKRRLTQVHWPTMQLTGPAGRNAELGLLSLLLPAAPILTLDQLEHDNSTAESESVKHLVDLRRNPTVQHGACEVAAMPSHELNQTLLAVARWKAGHASYVGVFNPTSQDLRANLTGLHSLPESLTLYHASDKTKIHLNYTTVQADDVSVPPLATVVLQFVPRNSVEN